MTAKTTKYRKMLEKIFKIIDQRSNASQVRYGNTSDLVIQYGREVLEIKDDFVKLKQERTTTSSGRCKSCGWCHPGRTCLEG